MGGDDEMTYVRSAPPTPKGPSSSHLGLDIPYLTNTEKKAPDQHLLSMKTISHLLLIVLVIHSNLISAQNVGINATGAAPAASAMLDIVSTTSGLLIPRVSLTATNAAGPITLPAASLLVYNTATAGTAPNNVTPGYYYWEPSVWKRLFNGTDAWSTTGNTGTTAGTNFIGTTDAKDFVTKTGGSAATNERLRALSAGNIVQNNTGIVAGDVFSVYANNTIATATNSITNTLGTFAVNGYASGNGTGLYGEVDGGSSTQGTAVWGQLFGTSTPALGFSDAVYGVNYTAPLGAGVTVGYSTGVRGEVYGAAGTALTIGVIGVNAGTAGFAYGTYGVTGSPNASGALGANVSTTGAGPGVQGQAVGVGGAAGVRGYNTATAIATGQASYGVHGSTAVAPTLTGFTIGVRGDVTGASGTTYGVYGQSASATGFGMDAFNSNAGGTGLLAIGNGVVGAYSGGGSGGAFTGNPFGALGFAKTALNGVGLEGNGNNIGTVLTPVRGGGVVGVGTQYGVMGFATTTVNTTPGTNSAAAGANASAGGYFEVQNAGTPISWAYVGVRDNTNTIQKIIGTGTVNTIVHDLDGELVALSCPEAPENLFQDYGSAQLVGGRAHVPIDPIFAKNIAVNERHPLRVFVQLEGDCAGVFVTNKSASGFDVVELQAGTSNTPFSYTIVANRADEVNPDGTLARYSDARFPIAPGPQQTTSSARIDMDDAAARKGFEETPVQTAPVKDMSAKKQRRK